MNNTPMNNTPTKTTPTIPGLEPPFDAKAALDAIEQQEIAASRAEQRYRGAAEHAKHLRKLADEENAALRRLIQQLRERREQLMAPRLAFGDTESHSVEDVLDDDDRARIDQAHDDDDVDTGSPPFDDDQADDAEHDIDLRNAAAMSTTPETPPASREDYALRYEIKRAEIKRRRGGRL